MLKVHFGRMKDGGLGLGREEVLDGGKFQHGNAFHGPAMRTADFLQLLLSF